MSPLHKKGPFLLESSQTLLGKTVFLQKIQGVVQLTNKNAFEMKKMFILH